MQVEISPIPQDMDAVSTSCDILVMQRLMQIANEVNDKLGSLRSSPCRQGRIDGLLGVVGQSGDDAAVLFAVTLKVDIAVLGRAVVRIDEMEVLCESAPFRVSDRIGPGGYLGHVIGILATEELLQVGFCRIGDEVACNVGCRYVSQT